MSELKVTCTAETMSFPLLQNMVSKLKIPGYIGLAAVYNTEDYQARFTYPAKLARDIRCSKATAMRSGCAVSVLLP